MEIIAGVCHASQAPRKLFSFRSGSFLIGLILNTELVFIEFGVFEVCHAMVVDNIQINLNIIPYVSLILFNYGLKTYERRILLLNKLCNIFGQKLITL